MKVLRYILNKAVWGCGLFKKRRSPHFCLCNPLGRGSGGGYYSNSGGGGGSRSSGLRGAY